MQNLLWQLARTEGRNRKECSWQQPHRHENQILDRRNPWVDSILHKWNPTQVIIIDAMNEPTKVANYASATDV